MLFHTVVFFPRFVEVQVLWQQAHNHPHLATFLKNGYGKFQQRNASMPAKPWSPCTQLEFPYKRTFFVDFGAPFTSDISIRLKSHCDIMYQRLLKLKTVFLPSPPQDETIARAAKILQRLKTAVASGWFKNCLLPNVRGDTSVFKPKRSPQRN